MKSTSFLVAVATIATIAHVSTNVDASAVELTKENFDATVHDGGKNAFVKFLAPW